LILSPAPETPLHDLDLPLDCMTEEDDLDVGEVRAVDAILEESGLSVPETSLSNNNERPNGVSQALKKHNASMDDVAMSISSIMHQGENDSSKLKAAEMIAKLHGHLKANDRSENISPTINLVVVSESGKAQNLMQVLVPTTS